jgi:hypothetical protein
MIYSLQTQNTNLHQYIYLSSYSDSAMGRVTVVQFPARVGEVLLFFGILTTYGDHIASYATGTAGLYPW